MNQRWWCVLVGVALVGQAHAAQGQVAAAAPADSARVVQVFLDCQRVFCDAQFVRTEIGFVNFVRDRQLADVHVIVTGQEAGGAVQAYTVEFLGQGRRVGLRDTAAFTTKIGDSEDDIRRVLVREIGLGLVRYVRDTPTSAYLKLTYQPKTAAAATDASRGTRDPWNYWVYRVNANANIDGNSNASGESFTGQLSANRVTEQWKLMFGLRSEYNHRTFKLTDGDISVIQREFGGTADVIKSAGSHWSTGVKLSANQDLYRNYDLNVSALPGLEYNIFPYSEATKRQVLLRYSVGARSFRYADSTIYGKLSETRPLHSFVVSTDMVQPWGNVGVSVNASQYLDDVSKRQVGVFGNARWRIVRGLDFNIGGGYSYIRDQLNIRKSGLTDEEILIRLREQRTNYEYFTFTGLSYTFGSAFSNVVNTRFGGGDRFFFFF